MTAPFFLLLVALGCAPAPDRVVVDEVLPVACGTCVYRLPGGRGCYWAVALDGEHYPVAGATPPDHDNHAPDGMCNMERRARISGELRGENFVASRFELLPATEVPDDPRYDEHDEHGADHTADPR